MVTLVPIEKGFSVGMEIMDIECRTSVFGIMSCHLMLAMRLKLGNACGTGRVFVCVFAVWCSYLTPIQQCW